MKNKTIHSYKDLIVWEKSMNLVEEIYGVTKEFPATEQYGLVTQMRRCAVSIPSNIAEGYMHGHTKEYIRFLRVAFGSGAELETQCLLSYKLSLINETVYKKLETLIEEVMKMLNVLIKKLTSISNL